MSYLRTIKLKVEISPGTDIREACCDLCELADRVGCMVEAKFNGVLLWAKKGDNPLKLAEAWEKALTSGRHHKIAMCR